MNPFSRAIARSAPRLPPGRRTPHETNAQDRFLLWGLGVGAAVYTIAPEISGMGRAGLSDEVAALMAAMSAAAFSTLKSVQALCEADEVRGRAAQRNVATSSAVGTGIGGTVVSIFQASIAEVVQSGALAVLIDGGLVLTSAMIGAAVAKRLNKKYAAKVCTHGCGYTGLCSQKICRRCLRLYFPSEKPVECSKTMVLDWYQAASYLQEEGKMSYLDAELLAVDFGTEWGLVNRADTVTVRCSKLTSWVAENLDLIEQRRGSGDQCMRDRLSDGPFLEPFKDVRTGSLPSRLEAKIDEFLCQRGC